MKPILGEIKQGRVLNGGRWDGARGDAHTMTTFRAMSTFGVKFGQRTVKTKPARRALTAWLAVFALFVQAFAPLGSAWAFDDQSGGLQVICTANGVQTIAVDRDGKPIDPQAEQASCPFCVLHASAAILTPTVPAVGEEVADTRQAVLRPVSDVHASLWRAGPRPPRGPPARA